MASTSAICTSFKSEMLAAQHNCSTNVFKMALYLSAATLSAATTTYSATNEVSGSGYVAGGVTLTGNTIWTDTTTVGLSFSNPTFPAAGTMSVTDIAAALIYNSSVSNKSVATFAFSGTTSITSGSITYTMPAQTTAAGLIKFS